MPQATVFLQIHPSSKTSKIPISVPEEGTLLGLFIKELCELVNVPHACYESEVGVFDNGNVVSALENGITHAMPGDVLQIVMRKVSHLAFLKFLNNFVKFRLSHQCSAFQVIL